MNGIFRIDPNSIKLNLRAATIVIVCFVFASVAVAANGADEYAAGTVSKISENAVSVKTAAGNVIEVSFDKKTMYL